MYSFTARLEALHFTCKSLLKSSAELKICALLNFNMFSLYIIFYNVVQSIHLIFMKARDLSYFL